MQNLPTILNARWVAWESMLDRKNPGTQANLVVTCRKVGDKSRNL
jgi:hypothetical protein